MRSSCLCRALRRGITAPAMIFLVVCLAGFALPCPAHAQDEYPDRVIDADIQAAAIDSVTRVLNGMYVYPDVADETERIAEVSA